MLLREGAAGSGLQVPLEGNGSLLIAELNRGVKFAKAGSAQYGDTGLRCGRVSGGGR
jgi:hypothetical protein